MTIIIKDYQKALNITRKLDEEWGSIKPVKSTQVGRQAVETQQRVEQQVHAVQGAV